MEKERLRNKVSILDVEREGKDIDTKEGQGIEKKKGYEHTSGFNHCAE